MLCYVFITPGGTEPKGPYLANYLPKVVTVRKLVLFTRESPYFFPFHPILCLLSWLLADRLGGCVLQVFSVLLSAAKAGPAG